LGEKRSVSGPPTQGVYYSLVDYAGFWRRLLVDIIDFTLLLVATITVTMGAALLLPAAEQSMPKVLFLSGFALGFAYLVLLKRSRFRTLGYLVGGIRIVSIHGERPSLWSLTVRALFAVFGPFNVLIDILWLTNDERRQALRDKLAHTYVIRDRAVPLGHGAIGYTTYTIFGWNLLFAEVRRASSEGP
jgi:uncharacterized RDD family membrane protein YckC